ncbi:MAG: hypothetical protein H6822_34740 [Planctomycetaceae bacterium]|nr:hypothetical protein [Planctomycetales bacterium]MCB9927346.1 hypothetical protein [Planctomycetaceae bacterium]
MSIEFGCSECGKLLRVPDTYVGKKARCPACGAIQEIASPRDAQSTAPEIEPDQNLSRPDSTRSTTPPSDSPFAAARSTTNPFADGASIASDNPFAASATNPYATPTVRTEAFNGGSLGLRGEAWARTSVEGPANSLVAVGGVVLIFSTIALAINVTSLVNDGNIEGLVFWLFAAIPYGIVVFGAMRMKQLKSYPLAIAASILAMLPCSACCILGLPVGIWSLVVLCNRDIRKAFRRNA